MSFHLTTCPYCSCGCGMLLYAAGDRLQGTHPSLAHPISQGSLCIRGWNCTDAPHSHERLTEAMIRKDGVLVPVAGQEAVAEIATRLKGGPVRFAARGSENGASILFAVGPTLANEDVLAVKRLARLLGARAGSTELSGVPVARRALRMVTGYGYATQGLKCLARADLVWIFGADVDNFPQVASRLVQASRRGARLVQFDVYASSTLGRNSQAIAVPPDAYGILPLLLEKAAIELRRPLPPVQQAPGFSNFADQLTRKASLLPKHSQLKEDRLKELASALLGARRPAVVIGERWLSIYDGTRRTAELLQGLALLGVVDRVVVAAGEAASWGACDVLQEDQGEGASPLLEQLCSDNSRKPSALFIIGDDLVRRIPRSGALTARLESIELVVVIDRFRNDTLPFAHVVLPSCAFGEADGTLTNAFGVVQRWRAAVRPRGDACPERAWLARIGRLLGYEDWPDAPNQWLRALQAEIPCYGSAGVGDLYAEDGPCGVPVREAGSLTFRPHGMAAPPLSASEEYPLRLFFASHPASWSTGALSRREELLNREVIDSKVFAAPGDIKGHGLKPGEQVRVVAPHGEALLTLRENGRLPEGTLLAVPLAGSQAGALRGFYPDPSGRSLGIQPVPARLEKS